MHAGRSVRDGRCDGRVTEIGLLRNYPVVEHLDLLENYDVIERLDELTPAVNPMPCQVVTHYADGAGDRTAISQESERRRAQE